MTITNGRDEHVDDDLGAYGLGALETDEAARVGAHLRRCSRCRIRAEEYAAVARLAPLALARAEPPAGARAALLARLDAPQGGPSLKTRLSEWWAAPRRRAQPLAWTLTLAVIVGLLGWNLRLRQQHDTTAEARALLTAEDREVTPLTGSAQARGATARLVLRRDDPRAGLVVSGLPPLPPGRSYQLWFVRPDQTRASGAVFRVDAQGEAVVLVQIPETLGAFRGVGVTEEPAGGSPAPTGRNLLAGALSSLPP